MEQNNVQVRKTVRQMCGQTKWEVGGLGHCGIDIGIAIACWRCQTPRMVGRLAALPLHLPASYG